MPQVPTNNFDISGLSGIPGALVGAFQGERNLQFQKETQQTSIVTGKQKIMQYKEE